MTTVDDTGTTPLGWGILGASRIGATVAADLRLVPGARLVAVGSRDAERAGVYAEEVGAERAHGSYEDLVADPDVDVVYVGTTHEAHPDGARLAVEAGKAVLCEKPFAVSAPDAAPVLALARERGVFCMEAMWTRCIPAIRELVALVREGAVGEVVHVTAQFSNPVPYDPSSRLHDPARAGGSLLDLGIYPVTFARLVLGVPTAVAASARLRGGIDMTTQLLLTHEGGVTAAVGCSMETSAPMVAEVHGTSGRIVMPLYVHPGAFTLHRPDREPEERVVPHEGRGYVHELVEVADCLSAGRLESPLVPHAETLGVLETLDEARAQIGLRYPFEDAAVTRGTAAASSRSR